MVKRFNITGLCFPNRHYMADVSEKWDATFKMIEEGDYFIINRPRQYGKTTTLHIMRQRLIAAGYVVFHISFEGIGDTIFTDEALFTRGFMTLLSDRAHESVPELKIMIDETALRTTQLQELAKGITEICSQTSKRVVLMIDEVDKSSNYGLFINFLAMLRDKFLDRDRTPTFHSVVLAGVHDIKSLKLKIRPDEAKTYNSPWNIATPFRIDMDLSPSEIKPMLDEYVQEQGVAMDSEKIAKRLFYFASGYPYLTSHLCKIIAEEILPKKTIKEWTEDDVFAAFQILIRIRNNTNFDTLVKNLKEYPELYNLAYATVIGGLMTPFNDYDSTISLGVLHGIFARSPSGALMVHNRIYREIIGEMMISEWRTHNIGDPKNRLDGFDINLINPYRLPNNGLDLLKIVENFQNFMRQHYSNKDRDFLERDGRLIFLAFLKPIINGGGHEFKEPQVSEERRVDVVITYYQHQYIVELKVWHGQAAHEKGLIQLADYLDRMGLSTGYLVIFDHNKKKSWKSGWVEIEGKRIFWVKV